MSLETNIAELNNNIVALIGALRALGNGTAEKTEPAPELDPQWELRDQPEAEEENEPAEGAAGIEVTERKVTFDDVKRAILELVAVDRKAALSILAKHKVAKAGDLPESAWAGVVFEAEAAAGK